MTSVFQDMPPTNITTNVKPANVSQPIVEKREIPSTKVQESVPSDTVELSTKTNKKEKKGVIKSIKGFIASIKKTLTAIAEYAKGAAKGTVAAAVIGSLIYTFGNVFNSIKSKASQKAGTEFKNIPNKPIAIVAAVIAFAANIWIASLNSTEKQSEIDHRWTGHNN